MLNIFKKVSYYSILVILKIYFGEGMLSFCQFKVTPNCHPKKGTIKGIFLCFFFFFKFLLKILTSPL